MANNEPNVIFDFLFLKVSCVKYRYVVIGPSDRLSVETPLFLGLDLLKQSGVAKSNQCRVHNRYAKKGLATKLVFPEGVSVGGVNNCQSGVWFYNVQGVFKLIFEHQSRSMQLKLAPLLFEVWRSPNASSKLPDTLQLTMPELCGGHGKSIGKLFKLKGGMRSCRSAPAKVCRPFEEEQVTTIKRIRRVVQEDEEEEAELAEDEEPGMSSDHQMTSLPQENPYSLWWLSGEMVHRVESHARTCTSKEKFLTRALISFLKLVRDESKLYSIKDGVLASFFKLIIDYGSLSHDASKMKHFGTSWGVVDARQNALLCLVAEWLGKYMNSFRDAVADKVHKFKSENLEVVNDLPPADVLIDELFPECMRLLVGHWIGTYGSHSQMKVIDGGDLQKRRLMVKQGNRMDHSYFSHKENCGTSSTSTPVVINNRADHSYFSSPSSIVDENPNFVDAGISGGRSKLDHTYEAKNGKIVQVSNATSRGDTRKDHTYVIKNNTQQTVIEEPDYVVEGCGDVSPSTPAFKRFRRPSDDDDNSTNPSDDPDVGSAAIVNDPSKHSIVQLVLEFLNNSLVSGVAHVVYMRLLHL